LRWRFALIQGAFAFALSTLVRIILVSCFGPTPGIGWSEGVMLFLKGAHADLAVALGLWTPLAIWLALVPEGWLAARWHRRTVQTVSWLCWALLIFVAVAEYYFFEEYRSRFNTVAIDYLHYWTEVSGNIAEMYPIWDITALCILGSAAIVAFSSALATSHEPDRRAIRLLAGAVWMIVAAISGGTLTLIEMQFSRERLINELANNGLVAGLTALWTRDLDYPAFFPILPREEAWKIARRAIAAPDATLTDDPYSLQRKIAGDPSKPRLNVVLMLEESFGSEFWGCLTGKKGKNSLTPNLDRIANEQGLLFDHLLADGNRTIRGLEAIIASFPPLPGDSIVARTRTHGVETIAQVLKRDGYRTTFIYPGSGLFDGVGEFATENGYERFLEQKDFEKPVFKTTWGVCNEDLYDRALAEARTAHATGQPFFITTLSISNHQPFTYPTGRIPEPPNLRSRKNAVKYVDYAFGRFFEQAKKEEFWKDTIFIVVADHGARVYGSQTIPINSYQIPCLVVGPSVVNEPRRNNTPGCQLDVAPTILGLLGRPYETVFFGHDLQHVPAEQTRSMINHNRSIGLYRGERLVTFGLNKIVDAYTGTPWAGFNPLVPPDATAQPLIEEATALFQVADELYTGERYKLQPTAPAPPR
jgi:phosphoglycerol transferase MdoB-like AlkP superfamily enzyme